MWRPMWRRRPRLIWRFMLSLILLILGAIVIGPLVIRLVDAYTNADREVNTASP